jgi:curved DNA-binding protein CbpA
MSERREDMEAGKNGVDLYSLLKLDRDATTDDIHRSYRTLSTTFHPDKLPHSSQGETLQQIFLDIKKAHDILIDPVLRLTYDYYGEEGVTLLRRLQMEQREHEARREAAVEMEEEEDDDGDDDDGEEDAYNLYQRLEKLLQNHNYLQARQDLQEFMMQHDYHQNLSEDNQVHLKLSMEFPRVIDLKKILYSGKQYVQYAQTRIQSIPPSDEEERSYYRQRILQEKQLVDYQFSKFKDSQQAEVGFTLSSTQPRHVTRTMTGGSRISPKWSMAMGANTALIYPQVASVMALAGQKEKEEHHPVSVFVNTAFQPIPQSQISLTANLSNDDSHQFIVGSSNTFTNQTACRYTMTFLAKSPLATPLILNFKTYRHLKDIGMATGAVSVGGNAEMLQWNAKWEAHKDNHKVSASASVGMLQGNSLELSYRTKFRKSHWLEEYITIPKKFEVTSIWGQVRKIRAMVTQELSSLANHPTLGFGMEHDMALGRWTWIWELQYNDSTFKVPIPVLHLGSVGDSSAYYSNKLYHAFYCLLFQSMIADFLQDSDEGYSKRTPRADKDGTVPSIDGRKSSIKTKAEADRQLKLMERIAEKKRFLESQRRTGLVILQASYWFQTRAEDGKVSEIVAMDATKQLQFWVSDGQLTTSSIPKASWLGFYNLQTETTETETRKWDWRLWRRWYRNVSQTRPVELPSSEPRLTIRYSNSGNVYELTVGETEPFVLPCNDIAECLGSVNFVE